VMPLQMFVSYADGTGGSVSLPVEMWNLGDTFTWRGEPGRRVTKVTVDSRQWLPDIDRTNNSWPR
jgi:hypothetical protein